MIDIYSETWKSIEEWADGKLEMDLRSLEDINCDEKRSAMLRGRIALLRSLLNLPNE